MVGSKAAISPRIDHSSWNPKLGISSTTSPGADFLSDIPFFIAILTEMSFETFFTDDCSSPLPSPWTSWLEWIFWRVLVRSWNRQTFLWEDGTRGQLLGVLGCRNSTHRVVFHLKKQEKNGRKIGCLHTPVPFWDF